ncbi:cyclin-like protein [Encephalitozoon intestinalis ATCC 50506]|uniref:Cyclin-like protein n=1 Tax=Encephalitozoon intestinalis (strain ATCC 50506) TaxID=876142 RepID=E0S9E5_ENCIT|nr:cyclin-like protein [Encephalitozoon intestinalis ATCC 50506]ADM12209.1 cyclin-like protein [Encephalitozoon intestinalis ATCC 50506]UTX46016.1 cyclin-T1 [Encephalitozoon intestinalis]
MGPEYAQCKDLLNSKNVRDIVNISRLLGMPQKATYFTLAIYYKYIFMLKDREAIPIGAACILLSGKVNGSLRSLGQILRTSYKYYGMDPERFFQEDYKDAIDIELHACIAMDFNFEMEDPYGFLEKMCMDNDIDRSRAQTIWVMLNDTMYLPFVLSFSIKSIVVSCIFISDIVRGNGEEDINGFKDKYKLAEIDSAEIGFISNEIVSFYERVLK